MTMAWSADRVLVRLALLILAVVWGRWLLGWELWADELAEIDDQTWSRQQVSSQRGSQRRRQLCLLGRCCWSRN